MNVPLANRFCRIMWALSFFVEQNNYFGWNYRPKSDAELIADGITILLFALVWL